MPPPTGAQLGWHGPRNARSDPGSGNSQLEPSWPPSITLIITNIMSSSSPNCVEPLPAELEGVVLLNAEYRVLLCLKNECRKAVAPMALSEHLRKIHQTKLEVRRQVELYVERFPHRYDFKTVPLPPDGSAPQPVPPRP
jgi:hypothetical protein